MNDFLIILIAVGLVGLILLLRFIITRLVYKGADAIQHKINESKNEKEAGNEQNLADRFKQ